MHNIYASMHNVYITHMMAAALIKIDICLAEWYMMDSHSTHVHQII